MRPRTLLAVSLLTLASCGGGDDSARYQQLVEQAAAKEAEARLLGVDTPCQQTSQCGLLTFLEPAACLVSTYKVYSTVSPTAQAARVAADEQLVLAQQAIALRSQNPIPCPLLMAVPPTPVCVANQCQAAPLALPRAQ